MTWFLTTEVRAFQEAAGDFLTARPVDNTVLVTELAYLTARPSSASDQRYGWWQAAAEPVTGAFLQASAHPPILSMMDRDAAESLVDLLPDLPPMGVDGRMVATITAAWHRRHATVLAERSRITLYRLGALRAPTPPPGRARVATRADRDILVSWYERLMAQHPDDPSELSYVVDDPLDYGGITLWEVGGTPVAMAGRSRLVAGMVRLSAVYSAADEASGDEASGHGASGPEASGPEAFGDAAFVAACVAAQDVATDVLVFAAATDTATGAAYRTLGFRPALDRVMLAP